MDIHGKSRIYKWISPLTREYGLFDMGKYLEPLVIQYRRGEIHIHASKDRTISLR